MDADTKIFRDNQVLLYCSIFRHNTRHNTQPWVINFSTFNYWSLAGIYCVRERESLSLLAMFACSHYHSIAAPDFCSFSGPRSRQTISLSSPAPPSKVSEFPLVVVVVVMVGLSRTLSTSGREGDQFQRRHHACQRSWSHASQRHICRTTATPAIS